MTSLTSSRGLTRRARWPVLAASVFFIFALFGTSPFAAIARAADAVRLHVSPSMAEHGDLQVQVLMTRDPENRYIAVTAESENYYSSSVQELEGESAPAVKVVWFRSLPSGVYQVTGAVFDAKGKMKGSAQQSLFVFPNVR